MEIVDSIGVRVIPEMKGFKAQVEKEIGKIDTDIKINVRLGKLDFRSADLQIDIFRRAQELKRIELQATLDLDTRQADRALAGIEVQSGTLGRSLEKAAGGSDRLNTSLLKTGASVGLTTLKFGAMAGSLLPVLSLLASVHLAVQQMIPAFALLPAALVAGAVSIGALKIGLVGFSDALKSMSDPEKFAEAIGKLAPEAAKVAIALRDLRPEFEKLQRLVQNRLFAGLSGELRDLAATLLPSVRSGLTGVVGEFNSMARGLLDFGQSAQFVDFLNAAFQSTKGALSNIGDALLPVVQGLTEIAKVGLNMLPGLTSGFGDVAKEFQHWATSISASGELERMIKSALAALKDMAAIAKNVGSILSSVFEAATGSGDGLFATLRDITGTIAEVLKSAEGQTALTGLFGALRDIIKGLQPLLVAVGRAIADFIIPALQQLAPIVGVALASLAPAIEPLGRALAALAPVIGALARQLSQVLGKAIEAIAPVIEALAPVVVRLVDIIGKTLGGALTALAPLLESVANVLSEVLLAALKAIEPALPVLLDALAQMAQLLGGALKDALPTLVEVATVLGQTLATAISTLAPMLPEIVQAMVDLFAAVVPLLPELARLAAELLPELVKIIPELVPVLTDFIRMWADLLIALTPLISTIIDALIPAVKSIASSVGDMVDVVVPLLQGMFDFFSGTVKLVAGLLTGDWEMVWDGAAQAVKGAIEVIGSVMRGIGEVLLAPVKIAVNAVKNVFASAGGEFGPAIKGAIESVPRFLGNLAGILVEAGKALIRGLIEGIRSMAQTAVNSVSNLVGQMRNFFPFSPAKEGPFSGQGYTLYSGRALAEDFAKGINERSYLAEQAVSSMMSEAALPGARIEGDLTGAMEHTMSIQSGVLADSVATAVREGLSEATFEVDEEGQLRVTQNAGIQFNRR